MHNIESPNALPSFSSNVSIDAPKTCFHFFGKIWDKIGNIAIGSAIASVLANLFLGHYENIWLNKYRGPSIHVYGR